MKSSDASTSSARTPHPRRHRSLVPLAAALCLVACAPVDATDEPDAGDPVAQQRAALTAIGQVPYTNPQRIETCFENLEMRGSGPGATIADLGTATSTARLTLPVGQERASAYVRVAFRIEHTYVGDLVVELVRAGRVYTLATREGGSGDVLQKTVDVPLVSAASAGDWTLRVRDLAAGDAGRLVSYSVEVHHWRAAVEAEVNNLQAAVNAAYNATRVRFSGWQRTCAAATGETIRVSIYESNLGGGSGRVGSIGVPVSTTTSWARNWVHEFGHALGLGHEHWNPLSTCNAEAKSPGYDAATPSDPDSIMSYCASGSTLTALDRLVIQRRYGATGTFLMSPSGYVVRTTGLYSTCHVANATQMAAFGGFGVTTRTANEYSGSGFPDCAWPDGMYREPHTGAYRFVLAGTVCHLDSMDKVNAYGGPEERIEVPWGTDVNAGSPSLTNRGACPWPRDGFFRVPAYADVIRVTPSGVCRMSAGRWNAYEVMGFRSLPASNDAVPSAPTQTCPWPDGHYQHRSNPDSAFNLNWGSFYCAYQNSEHLAAASEGYPVVLVATTHPTDPASPLYGRTGGPTCVWPSGYYADTGDRLYALDWDSTNYCQLRSEAERRLHRTTWSGFADTVRSPTRTNSDFRAGRTFVGFCFP